MRVLHLAAVLVCTSLAAACGCKANLGWQLSPRERTLAIGESFTPTLEFRACGGTEPLADEIRWHAQDTSVVRVDSLSGRTTGLRPGTTTVIPMGKRYGAADEVVVAVREP